MAHREQAYATSLPLWGRKGHLAPRCLEECSQWHLKHIDSRQVPLKSLTCSTAVFYPVCRRKPPAVLTMGLLVSRGAFIPFIMAGDPDLATTEKALQILDEAGADVIELGCPYSVRCLCFLQCTCTQTNTNGLMPLMMESNPVLMISTYFVAECFTSTGSSGRRPDYPDVIDTWA